MAKLHFDLVSPERLLLSEEVDMVTAPGKEGDFGVLAGHAPFMTVLRPGIITVDNQGQSQRIFVRGGFAEVTPAGLTVLAEQALPIDELDAARMEAEISAAQTDVNGANSDGSRLAAQEKLDHLKALRQSVGA